MVFEVVCGEVEKCNVKLDHQGQGLDPRFQDPPSSCGTASEPVVLCNIGSHAALIEAIQCIAMENVADM